MSRILARRVKELRFRVKTFLGTRPSLYFPIYRFKNRHSDLLVNKDTDLCVEGFPRSANSFTVSAISAAQTGNIRIAHHTHVPANAIRACQLGVPTLILIRDPFDAITSLTALRHQTRNVSPSQAAESPAISFALQINAWIAFYDSLLRHRDRYVIAPFETVIGDIGVVTAALNKEFGTDFDLFEHTSENVAALHQERGYHAGPSKQRSAIKEGVRSAFERQADSNPTVKARLSDATRLYERWISMSSLHANS